MIDIAARLAPGISVAAECIPLRDCTWRTSTHGSPRDLQESLWCSGMDQDDVNRTYHSLIETQSTIAGNERETRDERASQILAKYRIIPAGQCMTSDLCRLSITYVPTSYDIETAVRFPYSVRIVMRQSLNQGVTGSHASRD